MVEDQGEQPGGQDGGAGLHRQHGRRHRPLPGLPQQDLVLHLRLLRHLFLPLLRPHDEQVRDRQRCDRRGWLKVRSCLFRIIPLTVVLYRVLMVCHVDFCFKYGEKNIRDILFRFSGYFGYNQNKLFLKYSLKIQHLSSVRLRPDDDALLQQSEGLSDLQQQRGETQVQSGGHHPGQRIQGALTQS